MSVLAWLCLFWFAGGFPALVVAFYFWGKTSGPHEGWAVLLVFVLSWFFVITLPVLEYNKHKEQ